VVLYAGQLTDTELIEFVWQLFWVYHVGTRTWCGACEGSKDWLTISQKFAVWMSLL